MKKLIKVFTAAAMLLLVSSLLFADPPKKTVDSSISVVEALQNSFRSISNTMLPAVVEVDVTETKTYTNPFGGMTNPLNTFLETATAMTAKIKTTSVSMNQKDLVQV